MSSLKGEAEGSCLPSANLHNDVAEFVNHRPADMRVTSAHPILLFYTRLQTPSIF